MKALVTGAGGFLGFVITQLLVERGDSVRAFQRGQYDKLDMPGVECIRDDLTNVQAVVKAAADCDIVFHVAAKAGVWGHYQSYYDANVVGTQNVIQACRQNNISKLVYTSSPSVVFSGRDEQGLDESALYPDRFLTYYPQTKAIAEQAVLQANDQTLSTVALRPHLIWGPGDPHLVKRIVDRSMAGKLKLVGKGENLVDSTYIDNAAHAHMLAADKLLQEGSNAACAGKVYFITNGEPLPMASLINRILEAAGRPAVTKSVSPAVAYAAGSLLELMYKAFNIESEPIMTRFVARQLACAHWYDISASRRDLGYEPIVSIEEGLQRLRKALSDG